MSDILKYLFMPGLFKKINFRKKCLVCLERKPNSHEHVFPLWLMKMTNTLNSPINWSGGKVIGANCKLPICKECNDQFNEKLEKPARKSFKKIQNGSGFNDWEAEIIIKWMWKMTQLFWLFHYRKGWVYWNKVLAEKCLNPIEIPRNRITLAISKARLTTKNRDNSEPLGLDVLPEYSSSFGRSFFKCCNHHPLELLSISSSR